MSADSSRRSFLAALASLPLMGMLTPEAWRRLKLPV